MRKVKDFFGNLSDDDDDNSPDEYNIEVGFYDNSRIQTEDAHDIHYKSMKGLQRHVRDTYIASKAKILKNRSSHNTLR